ncbi:hypothetical protein [Agrobacterium tumefaciens]|uniref:hypothetical protein n=1 Tax=Agrobacterium tumefaciens TaxID=358 RepID=UPI000977F130|nr:hypothetical protein BV900_27330 [Agrobacterium tumefaciens]
MSNILTFPKHENLPPANDSAGLKTDYTAMTDRLECLRDRLVIMHNQLQRSFHRIEEVTASLGSAALDNERPPSGE